MAATRAPRSRSRRSTPEGPTWDQVELAPVVLVKAGEEVLADRAVARFLAQARAKDPTTEVIRVEAATYEAHQLDTLVSPSLFGEPRLVLVPALEQMTDALLTDLLAYVGSATASADPEVSVVLRHNGGQRGRRLLEAVGAAGYPVVSCPPVKSSRDKSALVSADVARAGRRIEPEAVGALVDALGSDLRELCSAVDQLLADTQGTITAEHVSTYYAGRIEATGFTVADAAAAGSTSAAITALRHAAATGTDPVVVVAALATKVRQLARVAAAGGRRMSPADLGMAPWQVDRARRELSGWSDDALATAIVAVARADAEVKGGSRDAVYAVERAVLTVCRARSRGATSRR